MNNEWNTGTPLADGKYLTAIYNIETDVFFHSLSSVMNGKWVMQSPYTIVAWSFIPELPEVPKDLPQVEKITWYPISVWPERKGTYLVKGTAHDGTTIYDKLNYDGARWPENDFTFWAKQD